VLKKRDRRLFSLSHQINSNSFAQRTAIPRRVSPSPKKPQYPRALPEAENSGGKKEYFLYFVA